MGANLMFTWSSKYSVKRGMVRQLRDTSEPYVTAS